MTEWQLILIGWFIFWPVWTLVCAWTAISDLASGRVSWGMFVNVFGKNDAPVSYWLGIARRVGGVLLGIAMLCLGTEMMKW